MAARLTRPARRQLAAVLVESARAHGRDAAVRYAVLIDAAATAVGDDPCLAGSSEVGGAGGVRAYAVRLSRRRVAPELRVRTPRHVLLYRVARDGVVDVIGVVHDRMLTGPAARRAVREAGLG